MTHCREAQIVLLAWDEASDLPEPIADHVGRCPVCRARFDTLFPPIRMPFAAPERPLSRPWPRPGSFVALTFAGCTVAALLLWGRPRSDEPVDLADLIPPECEAEVLLAECPLG